jgi:hypothetical protein
MRAEGKGDNAGLHPAGDAKSFPKVPTVSMIFL